MYKMVEEYEDFNGVLRKEEFYFNLTKAELTEMQLSKEGTYASYLQRIIDAKDQSTLIGLFKELLLRSYGEKSEDGKHFRKSPELAKDFENSAVYSQIYMKLATDDVAAAKFVNGIIPPDVAKEMAKEEKAASKKTKKVTAKVTD